MRQAWNNARRERLLRQLGGKCARCGTTENLTFDCIRPTGDRHHRMSSVQRMSYYLRQARMGNLQVLCHYHNTLKGDAEEPAFYASAVVTW